MFERLKAKLRSLSAALYDLLIGAMTTRWYRQVLLECPMDATVLDVGIGTAHSLLENRDLVLSHRLQVVGVDMSRAYVDAGRKHVLDYGLSANVTMNHADIFEFNTEYKDKFDIIYFSGSFMIIPRNTEALVHCVKMLRSPIPKVPNGANIFFTLTFEKRTFVGMYVMPYVKKLLHLLTTVNFGEVTSEDQFRKVLTEANVDIVEVRIISDRYFRSEVVVMAKPRSKAE